MLHPSRQAGALIIVALVAVTCALVSLAPSPAHAGDVRTWRQLSAFPAFPPALELPIGVYDPVRHRVLAVDANYGGQSLEVYAFDLAPAPHWSELVTTGTNPGQRYLAALVFDPVRDRLLLFGTANSEVLEVWALSLSGVPAWQKLPTTGFPPGDRSGQSAVYDAARDRVIVFGGMTDGYEPRVFHSDVWELSLATNRWTEMLPDGAGPDGREGHGAIYDPVGQRMIVFGGHYEDTTRVFRNDLWELTLGASPAWSQLEPAGPVPGARSAFGMVFDPVRRRVLVHGGILADSGIEPDELWALSLDGGPVWTRIVTGDALRGRSYPLDVYDPIEDRLLACGGGSYPQASALSLAAPLEWSPVLPARPLLTPGARTGNAVVHDTRRDRFVVVGGTFSPVDSASWSFDTDGSQPWSPSGAPAPPRWGNIIGPQDIPAPAMFDSVADRIIVCDRADTWTQPAEGSGAWTRLEAPGITDPNALGLQSGVALDTRRHRLIATGGRIPLGYAPWVTVRGVWSLSLDASPRWEHVGDLPQEYGSAGHAQFYDPIRDRLIVVGGGWTGGRFNVFWTYGPTVWVTPLASDLQWANLTSTSGTPPPAPPDARVAFDWRSNQLFISGDSTVWVRGVDDTGPWTEVEFSGTRPTVTMAIVYDPIRDQVLAPFASGPGSSDVQVWAFAVGPMAVASTGASRTATSTETRWRSVTAYGLPATVERREEGADWVPLGAIAFDVYGSATFTDAGVVPGHDYSYRVSVQTKPASYHSDAVLVADPSNLRLALLGSRPNPAPGEFRVAFSLPAAGAATLELYDVNGRRCLSRDVGGLGPGLHTIFIERAASLRPGVYLARLQRAGETRTTRVVLM